MEKDVEGQEVTEGVSREGGGARQVVVAAVQAKLLCYLGA